MKSHTRVVLPGLFVLLVLAACGQQQPPVVAHGGPVRDHASFIDHLRARGLVVEPAGTVQQIFIRAPGTQLRISGGDIKQPAEVQSFDYEDARTAEADAEQIQGGTGIATVTWIAPPHFFRKERVLVLYVGTDQAVIDLLTEVLGRKFAGE